MKIDEDSAAYPSLCGNGEKDPTDKHFTRWNLVVKTKQNGKRGSIISDVTLRVSTSISNTSIMS